MSELLHKYLSFDIVRLIQSLLMPKKIKHDLSIINRINYNKNKYNKYKKISFVKFIPIYYNKLLFQCIVCTEEYTIKEMNEHMKMCIMQSYSDSDNDNNYDYYHY